jgi:hypothetical protein
LHRGCPHSAEDIDVLATRLMKEAERRHRRRRRHFHRSLTALCLLRGTAGPGMSCAGLAAVPAPAAAPQSLRCDGGDNGRWLFERSHKTAEAKWCSSLALLRTRFAELRSRGKAVRWDARQDVYFSRWSERRVPTSFEKGLFASFDLASAIPIFSLLKEF